MKGKGKYHERISADWIIYNILQRRGCRTLKQIIDETKVYKKDGLAKKTVLKWLKWLTDGNAVVRFTGHWVFEKTDKATNNKTEIVKPFLDIEDIDVLIKQSEQFEVERWKESPNYNAMRRSQIALQWAPRSTIKAKIDSTLTIAYKPRQPCYANAVLYGAYKPWKS